MLAPATTNPHCACHESVDDAPAFVPTVEGLADAADLVAVASEEMAAHRSRHRAKIRLVPGHLVAPRRAVLDEALGYPTPGSGAPRG